MPELPDIGTFRRAAERCCLGREIARVVVNDPGSIDGVTAAALQRRLHAARLQAFHRHGKHLLALLDPPTVLTMHFGTNGALRPLAQGETEPASTRLRFDFTDGSGLAYVNPRRIGRVSLAPDEAAFVAAAGLGPDALDPGFDATAFAAALAGRRQALKTVLMDQTRLAGIGNIYADEILFQAGLPPDVPARALDAAQTRRLFATMLQAAIDHGVGAETGQAGAPAGWLLPERHKGGHCPRCGRPLRTETRGGRTGYFCPHCQPALTSEAGRV